jgi:toxin ParE1/3/4
MSLPIVISQRAERDIAFQYEWYLNQAGLEFAERYLLAVDQTIRNLAEHPDFGIKRHFQSPELAGIRSSLVRGAFQKHLVFYRADSELSIVRVMHGARDLPNRLTEDPDAT